MKPWKLGDRRYLLSPQDLSGLAILPELVQAGVTCLKIEGRLKAPEYVANVTHVYREALDRVMPDETPSSMPNPQAHHNLEMAFSRGLHTGWFESSLIFCSPTDTISPIHLCSRRMWAVATQCLMARLKREPSTCSG